MGIFRHIFKGDRGIWMIFLVLCIISILEVFSATSTLTYKSGDYWSPITKHALLLAVGVGVMVFVHNLHYRWFRLGTILLLPLSAVLLVVVMVMGRVDESTMVNGSARFLALGGIQFQPSELAKMAVLIFTASILSRGQSEKGAHHAAFWWILGTTTLFCALIMPENASTAALLFISIYMLMFVGRVQWKKLIGLAVIGGASCALFCLFLIKTQDSTLNQIPLGGRMVTWKYRILDFTEKDKEVPAASYDLEENWQRAHANIAIAKSGLIGSGPGNSVQRDFLSQAFSDFIYAIILEELGLAGGIIVVLLYISLLVRIGKIAQKCDRSFPALLVLGIGILLVTQAIFNMGVAVSLFPITGQPLPLVSKGGSSIIINCVYIGMILSVSRYTAKAEQAALEKSIRRQPTLEQSQTLEFLQQEQQYQEAIEPDEKLTGEDMRMR